MDYTNSQILALINEHIHSKRNRDILICRMIDGMHYEPLAEKCGLSTVQVKRIVAREQRILFRYLNDI